LARLGSAVWPKSRPASDRQPHHFQPAAILCLGRLDATTAFGRLGFMNPTTGILIASINPSALPALRIAGAMVLIVYWLAGVYLFRHRRQLFGRDSQVEQDIEAARHTRVAVVLIPWLAVTTVVFVEWLGLWSN